jgi:hypothetical protein
VDRAIRSAWGKQRRITIGSAKVFSQPEARRIARSHLAEARLQKLPQVQRIAALESEVSHLKGLIQSLAKAVLPSEPATNGAANPAKVVQP